VDIREKLKVQSLVEGKLTRIIGKSTSKGSKIKDYQK
jgi:hypothetical protein